MSTKEPGHDKKDANPAIPPQKREAQNKLVKLVRKGAVSTESS